MKDIKELIYVLKQNNLQPLPLSGKPADKNSKLALLYQGIEKGKFQSDEDAARQIYPDETESPKYRKLKSDLREKLLNALINFNATGSDYSDYQKAYYECHRQWLMVKILTGQNANTAAMYLANKLLKQSEKFEFSMLSMDISSYLRIQYGLRESNDKKYKEAGEAFDHYRKVYDWECLAEQLYTELVVSFVNNRSAKESVHLVAEEHYKRISSALREFHSYRLHMHGHMIGLMRFTTVNNYQQALDYCAEVIRFFNAKPYEARVPLQIFYYQELICSVQLRQFEKGQEAAKHCLELMQEGTFNWFKYQELYLMLTLHTGEYTHAADVLANATKHPRFQFQPDNSKELWRIYEGYVYFLATLGKITAAGSKNFKISKFVNETPIFSKDKSGMNIAILIIRLLYMILDRKYGQLLDEVEAIEQYCYRYLNEKNTHRSYYFIKLLLQIPIGQFDVAVIEKKGAKFLEKLDEIPLQVANQTHEIEIIPYEILWQLVLEALQQKK